MKLSTLCLLVAACLLAPAASRPALAQVAPAPRPAAPVRQALQELGRVYGIRFAFEERLLAGKTTTVRIEPGRSVDDLLKAILYPNGLVFQYVDKTHYAIVAKEPVASQLATTPAADAGASRSPGQTRLISGYVQDEQGAPLPGATVLADPSSRVGAATNAQGRV